MYTIASTAGLYAMAEDPAAVGLALFRHLARLAPEGPVGWTIATPEGRHERGYLDVGDGRRGQAGIRELTNDIAADLAQRNGTA